MFSGLIHHQGVVIENKKTRLGVQVPFFRVQLGDSIAVNGVCLTVIKKEKKGSATDLYFDVSEETLKKTTLANLSPSGVVNIEPALSAADALGGHLVQGHVDGVGRILSIKKNKASWTMTLKAPPAVAAYLVEKGSVALDGISLTVVDLKKAVFSTALIPFTWSHTNLKFRRAGDAVNLEADVMAKYVARYLRKK